VCVWGNLVPHFTQPSQVCPIHVCINILTPQPLLKSLSENNDSPRRDSPCMHELIISKKNNLEIVFINDAI
jgi:hypothetical protein